MAKKARTPPPPRRVQAPQRRDTKRADRRTAANRDYNLVKWGIVAGAIALAAIAGILFYVARDDDAGKANPPVTQTGTTATAQTNPFNKLPGIRKTKAPWPPEYASLSDRLGPLHLSALGQEELAFHIHQHLDVFVDGKPVPGGVPAGIGINDDSYITELHTHAGDGLIHVESATVRDYTLGEFVAEWGVYFDRKCLGAYCNGVKVYVNGEQQKGAPWDIALKAHQEIAIVAGKAPKKIPKSYKFAAGE